MQTGPFLSFLAVHLTLLLLFGSAPAQTDWCGSVHPAPEVADEIFAEVDDWLNTHEVPVGSIVNIPVAFHVVLLDEWTGDVDDEQIYKQIEVLNSAFDSTNFQFSLHSINRRVNPTWAIHCLYSQAEIDMKDELAIDPARVLNVYIVYALWGVYEDYTCNYSYPVLGYAHFPRDFPGKQHKTRRSHQVHYLAKWK